MSTDGSSIDKKEFEAAQALLDLNIPFIRGSTNERKIADDHQYCVQPVAQQPIVMTSYEVGTVSRIHAVTNITTTESDVATTSSPKMNNPDQEVTNARHDHTHHSEENVTVTSVPGPSFASSRDSAKQDNASKVSVPKIETRDVRTHVGDDEHLAIGLTMARIQKKLKSLEERLQSYFDVSGNVQYSIINTQYLYCVNSDDDESNEMTMDDSDDSDSDMDCNGWNRKVKTEHRAGPSNENPTTVLSNRNVNANADDLVPIGNGNALIPSSIYRNVNWTSYTSATRKLLMAVFPRRVLATHSLTGKPSPAFPNKPAKKMLDPALVNDIVQTVAERCGVAGNLVRTIITIKCADESKMFRTREINKNKSKREVNENIPPSESDSD